MDMIRMYPEKKNDLFDKMKKRPVFHTKGTVFTYGGKSFIGTDIRLTGSFREITDQTEWIYYSHEKYFTAEGGWSYEAFYAAAGKGNDNTDIFECLDDGKLYVPGSNTLFLWIKRDKKKGRNNE